MEVKEYDTLLGELETRVDRLRALYDQYFMGIEKTIPNVPHKDVERRIFVLRHEQVRNTALRFRFQMVVQKYNTYQTFWQRICRQIEEGTYKRHLLRAKAATAEPRRLPSGELAIDVTFEDFDATSAPPEEPAEPPSPQALVAREAAPATMSLYDDGDAADKTLAGIPGPAGGAAPAPPGQQAPPHRLGALANAPVARPAAGAPAAPAPAAGVWRMAEPTAARAPALPASPRPAPASPASPRPAAASPASPASPRPAAATKSGDLSDARVREIYVSYVEAKRARSESTAGITYEQLSKSLRESGERLRQKHGKSVDFEVTVKNGKTILKPVLR